MKDTYQIYHNVFSFTNRLKARAVTMDTTLLRTNLASCLVGRAERWYTEELSNMTRIRLQTSSIAEWCDLLEKRFRDTRGQSLAALKRERYTI